MTAIVKQRRILLKEWFVAEDARREEVVTQVGVVPIHPITDSRTQSTSRVPPATRGDTLPLPYPCCPSLKRPIQKEKSYRKATTAEHKPWTELRPPACRCLSPLYMLLLQITISLNPETEPVHEMPQAAWAVAKPRPRRGQRFAKKPTFSGLRQRLRQRLRRRGFPRGKDGVDRGDTPGDVPSTGAAESCGPGKGPSVPRTEVGSRGPEWGAKSRGWVLLGLVGSGGAREGALRKLDCCPCGCK